MSYIAIIIGTCAVIVTAFASAGFMLWVGAKIYYQGTLMASPRVYESTRVDEKTIEDEDEVDIFDIGGENA